MVSAIAIGLLAAIAVFSLTRKDQPQYFTAKVERGDIRDSVEATGTINAVTTVLVGSQVSGRIAKLSADFNSRVRKGQVIAEIDPALFQGALLQASADLNSARANVVAAQANLEKAKAALVQTKADYDRATTLEAQDSIAMQEVDLSQRQLLLRTRNGIGSQGSDYAGRSASESKSGAVSVARTNLEYTVIRSPIDGTVVARNVDVGQTVAASLQAPTLFTIAQDLTKMQVYAKIDESNVGNVKVGRRVTFKVDAFPKDVIQGVVSQVRMNPAIVQNVVNYDAIIDFDNPDLKLFPGMTAYVTIPVASANNVLKVPNGALRYKPQLPQEGDPGTSHQIRHGPNDRTVVWKLHADNTIEPVKVTLGITDHSYTALTGVVVGELKEGDNVITGVVPVKNQVPGGASLREVHRRR